MVALLRFFASNAWLITVFCLLGAARYVFKAVTAYRAGAATPYALERESANSQVGRFWLIAVVLTVVGLAALFAGPLVLGSTADLPNEPSSTLVAGILTRTPQPPTPVTPLPTPSPTPTPQASATLPPQVALPAETATPEATPALPLSSNCPDPGVQLSAPLAGQLVSGAVELVGTASIPGFDYYKVEINGPITGGEWWTVGEPWRTPVTGGVLGYWDAGPIVQQAPGIYQLRLVVVDSTGNYPPPCTVQVRIGTE